MESRADLTAATEAVAHIVRGITDDQLDDPTPCTGTSVGAMLGHLDGLCQAFTAAAAKDFGPQTSTPPDGAALTVPAEWRSVVPARLQALAEAWRKPEAWAGMTAAGGVDLPGEIGGLVALDEVVLHGWDLARATRQPFDPGPEAVGTSHTFLVESRKEPVPPSLFGPIVDVPADAPLLDRAVGLAGRDPSWAPA